MVERYECDNCHRKMPVTPKGQWFTVPSSHDEIPDYGIWVCEECVRSLLIELSDVTDGDRIREDN